MESDRHCLTQIFDLVNVLHLSLGLITTVAVTIYYVKNIQ